MNNFNVGLRVIAVWGLGLGLMVVSGCSQSSDSKQTATSDPPATPEVYAHPTEGPHHGDLVELGNEEYHGEIVHDDDAGSVTAYILDSSAKIVVPIDATEIFVNLSHDEEAKQFVLAAVPESSAPEGKSSKFVSTDVELAVALDLEDAKAQLVVTIGGKQYRGKIHHDEHDH